MASKLNIDKPLGGMKKDYSRISFILRGSRRKAGFLALKEEAKIPKQIASECKISISNVSNTLPELINAGLVICNNPDDHYFKYYELTKRGKDLLNELIENKQIWKEKKKSKKLELDALCHEALAQIPGMATTFPL